MSRKKGNFDHNYPLLIKFLNENDADYAYQEFAGGQQIRIWGGTRIVDVWPSRMVFHIMQDEDAIPSTMSKWPRMDEYFDDKQLNKLLNGEII